MFSHLLGADWRFILVPSLGGAPFHVLGRNVYVADTGSPDSNLEAARRAIRTSGSFDALSPPVEVIFEESSNQAVG